MDAYVQLALMAKAKRTFESEDTFMSFPALSAISFPPERLAAMLGNVNTPESLQALAEISRLTNTIPKGSLFDLQGDEYLWDVYSDVLNRAELATGSLTPEEDRRYRTAIAILYQKGKDGRLIDSVKVLSYRQYRDASIAAQEAYRSQQATAEAATDATALARWRNSEEPNLRQQLQQISDDWRVKGFKAEVETARQIELSCASKSPAVKWHDWRTSFDPNLDMLTDANGQRFALTSFSPGDILTRADWPQFTMTGNEILQLVEQAPNELKRIFGSIAARPNIDSLSFEYRSVAITRPWFAPSVFPARFWRLDESMAQLSDGGKPAAGRCPAYVSALVFVRNITMKLRPSAEDLGSTAINAIQPSIVQNLALRPEVGSQVIGITEAAKQVIKELPRSGDDDAGAADVGLAFARLAGSIFSTVLTATTHTTNSASRPQVPAPAPAPLPARQQEHTPLATLPPNSISILAFICKRVPRCPDPDPALAWPGD